MRIHCNKRSLTFLFFKYATHVSSSLWDTICYEIPNYSQIDIRSMLLNFKDCELNKPLVFIKWVFCLYVCFWERVSLFSPRCPETCYVDQAGLNFTEVPCLCFLNARSKGMCPRPALGILLKQHVADYEITWWFTYQVICYCSGFSYLDFSSAILEGTSVTLCWNS